MLGGQPDWLEVTCAGFEDAQAMELAMRTPQETAGGDVIVVMKGDEVNITSLDHVPWIIYPRPVTLFSGHHITTLKHSLITSLDHQYLRWNMAICK